MLGMTARLHLSGILTFLLAAMTSAHICWASAPYYTLEFSAKPVKETVEFCEPVEVEFTFKNAGDKPFWVHLPSATYGPCSISCSWGGGATGGERWPEGLSREEQWLEHELGESYTFCAIRPKLGTVGLDDVTVTFTYSYYRGKASGEYLYPYTGVQKACMRYRISRTNHLGPPMSCDCSV